MNPTLTPHQIDTYATVLWTRGVAFVPSLITAVIVVIFGWVFSAWISRSTGKILERSGRVDITVQPAIVTALRYGILLPVLVIALGALGIQTASLLAVIGAAGLAIGLALQGTLTNIAAGAMLLWLRPFRVGDYIEVPANGIGGTVHEVSLFISILETIDGIRVVAPNNAIWNATVRNHTHGSGRLVSYAVSFQAGADIERARDVLLKMLRDDPRVAATGAHPLIFAESAGTGGTVLNCSFRVGWGDLGEIQRGMIERMRGHLEAAGDAALVPQQVTRTIPADADPSRFMVAPVLPA